MIKHIKFTSVAVKDQQRALEFYSGKLGFQVETDAPYMAGQRWIELRIPGAETRIVLSLATGQADTNTPSLVLVADDVQKTYEELKQKGVEFTQPPKQAPWGLHAMFKDSEGNLVLLGTP